MAENTEFSPEILEKGLTRSKTIWGIIFTAVPTVVGLVNTLSGVDFGPEADTLNQFGLHAFDLALAAVGLVGGVWAWYGRVKAKAAIVFGGGKNNANGA